MTPADSVHSTPPTNTSADSPASNPRSPQDSLFFPTDITPEQLFRAIGKLRKEARDEIERLLTFLDDTDNHMEREPDGDEDDASYPESGCRLCTPGEDDEDSDADEDDDPAEPSLGFLERHPTLYSDGRDQSGNQDWLYAGLGGDREDEHDGAEPENEGGEAVKEDDEPSLGWTDEEAARGRTYAGSMGQMADLEHDVVPA